MDQPLLSDLCAICLTSKPKYRCPRCKSRTCSLPCYKRHQSRASCTGKRDPSTFLKKTSWATPSGLDQDYNYLKSLERDITTANQDLSHRGIGGTETREKSRVAMRGWLVRGEFARYLGENGIEVVKAPRGMARERGNHSRVTKGGNVFWTVEWVDGAGGAGGDGGREVRHDCLATQSVAELDALRWIQKRNAERRRGNGEAGSQGIKRKREQTEKNPEMLEEGSISHEETASRLSTDQQALSPPHISNEDESQVAPASETQTDDTQHAASVESLPQPPTNTDASTHPPTQASSSKSHYYLLKPATAGPTHVLIPLDPHTSLTECLRNQVVQEYPTIYVLPHPPEELPGGFMLSKEYEASIARNAGRLPDERAERGGQGGNDGRFSGDVRNQGVELDPSSILQMLKRDISL